MKTLSTALAALLLGGCATFENSVWCSPDGKQMAFVSWYSRVGVAEKIDSGVELCRGEVRDQPGAKPAVQAASAPGAAQ